MKITLLAAAAAFSIVTAAAHAESEGAGNPFAFSVPGITTVIPRAYSDAITENYVGLSSRSFQSAKAGHLDAMPATGSEGAIKMASSLPRGFSDSTVASAQARSVARFSAERERLVRVAAPPFAGARRG